MIGKVDILIKNVAKVCVWYFFKPNRMYKFHEVHTMLVERKVERQVPLEVYEKIKEYL